jgi:hypothetical protein
VTLLKSSSKSSKHSGGVPSRGRICIIHFFLILKKSGCEC